MSKNKFLGTYKVHKPKPREKALIKAKVHTMQVNKGVYDIATTREEVMEVDV